jgi:hypothetical protein
MGSWRFFSQSFPIFCQADFASSSQSSQCISPPGRHQPGDPSGAYPGVERLFFSFLFIAPQKMEESSDKLLFQQKTNLLGDDSMIDYMCMCFLHPRVRNQFRFRGCTSK